MFSFQKMNSTLFALHLVYLPLINGALNSFVEQWNSHPVTSASNYTPTQLWLSGILIIQLSTTCSQSQDFQNLGVDEDGPMPQDDSIHNVEVAEIPYMLSNEQEQAVYEIRQKYSTDTNGITSYLQVLQYLSMIVDIM